MISRRIIVYVAAALLSACASTANYSSSSEYAFVTEGWIRAGWATWGGPRVYKINDTELDFFKHDNGATYKVNSGVVNFSVWYFANRGAADGLFWQSDIEPIQVELKANGAYRIDAEVNADIVSFVVINIKTNEVLGRTRPLPITRRPRPIPL